MDREIALQAIIDLVRRFACNHDTYTDSSSEYNETQLRVDYLNPFLVALGWDVFNEKQAHQHLREVVHEDIVEIVEGDEIFAKKPDYALRLGAERKFFVEAKRPSVSIATNKSSAFQVRRYGWNARLSVSIITNFDKLAIYDTRVRPQANDDARIARLKIYEYTEYIDRFDEIYDRLSRESVYSGHFNEVFGEDEEYEGAEPFDEYFLGQIEAWREWLACDIVQQNSTVTQAELNFLVQRLLNRIIFLRVCEDRELEKYQTLQTIHTYEELKTLFIQADERYNSGLFDFIDDQLSLSIQISSEVLIGIFRELYYPVSPYAFGVVDAGILGEIYERFLAQQILVTDGQVTIVEKDEIVASRGVVPTPKCVVNAIVQKTLVPVCEGKSPTELGQFSVVDISCGSGSFLVAAYEYLLNHYLEWYLKDGVKRHGDKVYEGFRGTWYLTLSERQRILCTHIFGVDIDPQAVEITRFSLLLKALEDVPVATITAHLRQHHVRALPNLHANVQYGNSLVDSTYFKYDSDALIDEDQFAKLAPLEWETAFPAAFSAGGFDAIVGNPPYIRIQNMVHYSPYEVQYFQSDESPYSCAQSYNFDKYSLFIERGLSLLKPNGRLSYIIPHKFFSIKSGQALRTLLSEGQHIAGITHFGDQQVFGKKRTTYTCILSLAKQTMPEFTVEHVSDLSDWRRGQPGNLEHYQSIYLDDAPWEFISPATRQVFERMRANNPTTLDQIAKIFVGVQTSADKVFIFESTVEADNDVTFTDTTDISWTIEKAILRPCLKDVPLPPFSHPQPNAYIIFPYKIVGGRAELYTPAEMQENFPQCWAYLNSHRALLTKRSIQGGTPETWYCYGRSQSLTKFDGTPKLVWPVLSLEPRYAYDDHDIVFTGGGNGPYYGLRPLPDTALSIHYLQAVLSHPIIEAMVRVRGSVFRGGYRSHGKQFVRDLPIRQINFDNEVEKKTHDKIVQLVKILIYATERTEIATLPFQRQQVAQQAQTLRLTVQKLVSELYGITTTDLAAVEYRGALKGTEA